MSEPEMNGEMPVAALKAITAYLGPLHASDALNQFGTTLRQMISAAGINAVVSGRIKTPIAIWRECQRSGLVLDLGDSMRIQLHEIEDILGFRAVVDTIGDCYQVIGLLHTRYPAIPGRFRDFSRTHEQDGRRGVRTVVIGPSRRFTEVQIVLAESQEKADGLQNQLDQLRDHHRQMLERLAALENAVRALSPPPPAIGHNQPPEPIEVPMLDETDHRSIEEAIATLRRQPVNPVANASEVIDAVDNLRSIAHRVGVYIASQSDSFASEAVKEAGKETGKWAARLLALKVLAGILAGVVVAALAWLNAIGASL